MFWHLMKLKIQDWIDYKEQEFAQEESKGSWLSLMKWLEIYIYIDIHEIFFSEFPIILHEWLSNIATQNKFFQGGSPTE